MARSTAAPAATETTRDGKRHGRGGHAPVALPLGLWRLKRMWGLLLVAQLGMIAAVLLVCTVPVFARVAVGAGFQAALAAHPGTATFYAHASTNRPAQQLVDSYAQRVDGIRDGALHAYHVGQPLLELDTIPLTLPSSLTAPAGDVGAYGVRPQAMPLGALGGGAGLGGISLGGAPAQSLASDLRVTHGHLPQPVPDALEVVVGTATAAQLHLALGDTLPLSTQAGAQAPVVRVVGIVTLAATTFNYPLDPQTGGGPNGPTTYYWAVTSNEAILAYTYDWSQISQAIPAGAGPSQATWDITWTAPMDLSHLSAQDLGAILDGNPQSLNYQLIQLMNGGSGANGSAAPGNTQQGFASDSTFAESPLFDMLYSYQRRLVGAQILAGLLLADVLGLVLIFLARMASMLVERQEPLIALLRSRGASRGQIFGAFAVQTLLLGVVGLVVGAALALPAARIVSSALLPASERDTLSILDGNLVAVSTGAAIAALAVATVLVLAMLRAIGRATALNALAQRQESARPARKPLWQRFYLDVAAALLAFLAYGTYALANALAAGTSSGASSGSPTTYELQIGLSPLAVIAPAFLMVAGALLFLRVFPLLLRLAERIAMRRGGGVAVVLALAQLARNARKTAGIVLPLALATCFLLFVLGANATVEQQIADAAAFQAGADFSGGLTSSPDAGASGMRAREAAYAQVPGVRSVALGYRAGWLTVHCNPYTQGCAYSPQQQIQIEAVDADAFAQTAIWPPQDAAQPLAPLMAQLAAQRDTASASGTIPAILDRTAAAILNVTPGATFTLPAPVEINPNGNAPPSGTAGSPDLRFSVVAVVPYLPSTYGDNGGGLLADYAAFTAVYGSATGEIAPPAVAPNFAWLRTADDAASLASVRAAIARGPLALSQLEEFTVVPLQAPVSDRRALATGLHGDPLRLTVIGILDLGAVAALLLALCGTLIAAGVAARERGTALALLRALGTEPRRVRAEVGWEQGIVYGVALALGAALGAVLIEVMLRPLPLLIFTSGLGGPIEDGGPAARIIWPWPALAAALGVLVAICAVATLLAARLAARPSLARTLRLSGE
ncbi:MAG TPA: FtsX-like permease family protein [Ktedonobacterales bacterium]